MSDEKEFYENMGYFGKCPVHGDYHSHITDECPKCMETQFEEEQANSQPRCYLCKEPYPWDGKEESSFRIAITLESGCDDFWETVGHHLHEICMKCYEEKIKPIFNPKTKVGLDYQKCYEEWQELLRKNQSISWDDFLSKKE